MLLRLAANPSSWCNSIYFKNFYNSKVMHMIIFFSYNWKHYHILFTQSKRSEHLDNTYGLEQSSFHAEMAAKPQSWWFLLFQKPVNHNQHNDMECWEDAITNSPAGKSTVILIFHYCYWWSIIKCVAVLVAVVCCKAALPSGHFAITMLSLCLKSEDYPH